MRNSFFYEKDYNCYNIVNWCDPYDVYNSFYRYLCLNYLDSFVNWLSDKEYVYLYKDKHIKILDRLHFWDYIYEKTKDLNSVYDLNDENIFKFLKQLIVLYSNSEKYYNNYDLSLCDALDNLDNWKNYKQLVRVMRLAFNQLKKHAIRYIEKKQLITTKLKKVI